MLNVAGVQAQLDEFDELHSKDGPPVRSPDGMWLLYADGASREVSQPYGALKDPSKDPEQRAKDIALYYGVRRDRAVRAFHDRRIELQRAAKAAERSPYVSTPPSPEKVKAELEALRDKAQEAQVALDAALDAVEEAKPQRRKDIERQRVENRAKWQALLSETENIEL